MKLLVVSDRYPPYFEGGYELRCAETVAYLKQRGWETTVLTTRYGDAAASDAGVLRLLPYVSHGVSRGSLLYWWSRMRAAAHFRANVRPVLGIVEKIKPDVIFCWQLQDIGVLWLPAVQRLRIPVVFSLGDYWLRDCLLSKGLSRFYWGIGNARRLPLQRLVANSAYLKDEYVRAGCPSDTVSVLPRGIARERILSDEAPQGARGNAPAEIVRLLYVGRIHPDKGLETACEALAFLKNEPPPVDASLDIIGAGAAGYVAQLMRFIQNRGIVSQVRFLGQLSREVVLSRYQQYGIFILPVRWPEPFSMSLVEAMARGVAVIASREGGNPEIVEDGVNGLLVPAGDSRALAAAVRRLARDPQLSRQLVSHALRTVQERYCLEKLLPLWEQLLVNAAYSRKAVG